MLRCSVPLQEFNGKNKVPPPLRKPLVFFPDLILLHIIILTSEYNERNKTQSKYISNTYEATNLSVMQ